MGLWSDSIHSVPDDLVLFGDDDRQDDLGVPGHQVGTSRLIGGLPPSALWRRSVL